MRSFLHPRVESLVVGLPKDIRQRGRPDALRGGRQVRKVTRETVRHPPRADEQDLQPCKGAVGDAGATEAGAVVVVAGVVAVSAETEVGVEDGGAGDVLPVQRPVPVPVAIRNPSKIVYFLRCSKRMPCIHT